MNRQVMLYIAMSLDGYIATREDNIDFLSIVETPQEDFGYHNFLQNVDTIIWGRRTYDKVKTLDSQFHHTDKKIYVLSQSRTGSDEHVTYINDVQALVSELQKQPGKNIYCDGGSQVVYELLKHAQIDRLIVSIIPHLLGDGIRLFQDGRPEQTLQFKQSITYPSGLVQLWYDRNEIKGS